jgi:hypothetical protein
MKIQYTDSPIQTRVLVTETRDSIISQIMLCYEN